MRYHLIVGLLGLVSVAPSTLLAQGAATPVAAAKTQLPTPAPAPIPPPPRYLEGVGIDLGIVLSRPPTETSPQGLVERATFLASRSFKGTPRWEAAIADVDMSSTAMMRNFSVAAGRELTPQSYPRLDKILQRMRIDVAASVDAARLPYQRRRPYLVDEGETCQPKSELSQSFDYPSGHSSWGFSVALLLTELDGARAPAILERGRQYGESRLVCGMHNPSSVEAGRMVAGVIVTVLRANPQFRADLEAARTEFNRTPR